MKSIKNILAISGSTRRGSVNEVMINWLADKYKAELHIDLYKGLDTLPHFRPGFKEEDIPPPVHDFYKAIEMADGILICTPEYIFSLPGVLKNAFEWAVSTMVFTNKPTAIIVAASLGQKAYDELQLIVETLGAKMGTNSRLLITGIQSKFDAEGRLLENSLIPGFDRLVQELVSAIE